MQARYYDPVIGRFYSNDPVDTLGHITRRNPIHGFNRYTYANNNPYKYTDPDGEFGVIGFAIGFTVELASQAIAGEGYNLTKATVMGISGAVTGGMASLAKSSVTVGGKVVGSTIDKAVAGTISASGAAVSSAGASAVNDSMDGMSSGQIIDNAVESAIESVAPHVKAVGKMTGALTDKVLDKSGVGAGASDIGSQFTSAAAEKTISNACSTTNNEC